MTLQQSITAPRKFIGAILAASIAITGLSAVPARANDDVGKALAALAGIAIVGAVIHDKKQDKKRARSHAQPHVQPHVQRRTHVQPRPLPRKARRNLLPQRCLQSHRTHRGKVQVFGQRCLDRHYDHARSLPHRCELQFRTEHGTRVGYGAKCLRQAGFKLARG